MTVLSLLVLIGLALYTAGMVSRRRRLATALLDASEHSFAAEDNLEFAESWLREWLTRAGFRSASAPQTFLLSTVAGFLLGICIVVMLGMSGAQAWMKGQLRFVPQSIAGPTAVILQAMPIFLIVGMAVIPMLYIRQARRSRTLEIEQDLALFLELLATLAEAGLALDAAISRVLQSEDENRFLMQELQIYQREMLAGSSRAEALRRLARRIDLPTVGSFVSALIQTEMIGASLSDTLRRQANDLRDRRKMKALLLAGSLPVKLVFPLMICFLPGVFLSTLGPVLNQLSKVANGVLGSH